MNTWVTAPWMGFDTETTGISPTRDRIVSAASVVRIGGFLSTDPDQVQTWLANPGVPIPDRAAAIHGITTEQAVRDGRPAVEVLEEINVTLAAHLSQGGPVIVFNAAYDLPLLAADSARHGVPTLTDRLATFPGPILDPLVLDRELVRKRRGKRTLADLCAAYRIPMPDDLHQAHVDAQLTVTLMAAILEANPGLGRLSGPELVDYQREAHARWAREFQAWLSQQGRRQHIDQNWI